MATRLPPADPWDRQTGVHQVADFKVTCEWLIINEDWVLVRPKIHLHDNIYTLSKDTEILRVYSEVRGQRIESPELSAISWTKRALGSGGVPVLGMFEQNPGHSQHADGSWIFRWHASVGSRLSVAIVRLDGNLEGQARLVLVE